MAERAAVASRGGGDQRPRSAGSDCRGTVDGRRGAFNSMSRARAMLLPRGATAERRGMVTRDRPRPALRDAPVWEGPPGPSWAGIRHSSLAPPRILPAAVALPRGEFSCRARRTSTESHVEVPRPDRSSSGNSPSPPGPADGPARQALHRPFTAPPRQGEHTWGATARADRANLDAAFLSAMVAGQLLAM